MKAEQEKRSVFGLSVARAVEIINLQVPIEAMGRHNGCPS